MGRQSVVSMRNLFRVEAKERIDANVDYTDITIIQNRVFNSRNQFSITFTLRPRCECSVKSNDSMLPSDVAYRSVAGHSLCSVYEKGAVGHCPPPPLPSVILKQKIQEKFGQNSGDWGGAKFGLNIFFFFFI